MQRHLKGPVVSVLWVQPKWALGMPKWALVVAPDVSTRFSHTSCVIAVQVALVGAPNVGKSSLVNVLSSGVPEVCDYPFTTRSIKMGHFFIDGHRHQVHSLHAAMRSVSTCSVEMASGILAISTVLFSRCC